MDTVSEYKENEADNVKVHFTNKFFLIQLAMYNTSLRVCLLNNHLLRDCGLASGIIYLFRAMAHKLSFNFGKLILIHYTAFFTDNISTQIGRTLYRHTQHKLNLEKIWHEKLRQQLCCLDQRGLSKHGESMECKIRFQKIE